MHTSYETFFDTQHNLVFNKIKDWCEEEKKKYYGKIVVSISHNIVREGEKAAYHGSCIICFHNFIT